MESKGLAVLVMAAGSKAGPLAHSPVSAGIITPFFVVEFPMARDANELGTRLGAYSDAITGFSFAQNVAFCLALGTHDFAESVLKGGWLIPFLVLLASGFYAFMIWMCHRKQDMLLGPLVQSEGADRTTATIRIWQFLVIIIGTLMTTFGVVMSWVGNQHPAKHLWFPFVGQ